MIFDSPRRAAPGHITTPRIRTSLRKPPPQGQVTSIECLAPRSAGSFRHRGVEDGGHNPANPDDAKTTGQGSGSATPQRNVISKTVSISSGRG